MVTVACVYVRGEYPYTPEYVWRLSAMVRRWMDRPFRFVCLTDRPEEITQTCAFATPIRIASLSPNGGCWSKLELFNPARAWSGRVLYLDLDSLIVAPLAPILDYPAPFAITEDEIAREGRTKTIDRFGRRIVRRFNSSVMVWDPEVRGPRSPEWLYQGWRDSDAERLSGDQDWIGEQWPDAAAMPASWFPRISRTAPPWPSDAKVILVKHPKNHIAAARWPWFKAQWGAA